MKMALAAVPVIAVILLSGCTKGSSSSVSSGATYSPLTGVFSDAPVAGLTYKTSSGAAGTTDAQGRFNYASDSVTFSVGGMLLGTAAPQLSLAGNAPVTPVDLGTSSASTIGQLLGTLNSIAVARNMDAGRPLSSGVFTMPDNAADLLQPYVALTPPLNAADLSSTDLANIATSGASGVGSAAVITVTSPADATLNLNQAVNASSVIGTVWTGDGGPGTPAGTFYFQPDGNMTGFISYPNLITPLPGLADGDIWAGTWSGSTTAAGVQFSLISSAGGNYSGTIINGAGTIYDSSSNPVFTLTQATSLNNTKLTNSLYLGGWYGVYTPVSPISNPDVYGAGTPVYLILSPDGTFSGIMDGNQTTTGTIIGNWTPTSGIGSGTFVKNTTATFSFDMATQTGWYAPNGVTGVTVGYISFSRTGILSMNNDTLTTPAIAMVPLLLDVNITWSPNSGGAVSGFPLALNINNSSAQLIASGIKSEINPLGNGAVAYTMKDSISVPYPNGTAANYVLSAGTANCTFTNGSNIGIITSPQPVTITCN